ncbi:aspartate aminotransferase family protein [Sphingomonas sp. MMS24-J45]|uniref:aspartate aminotransferase family protein n=1 Tax=Sphingomonas sp. MMS24-J45 TaxID=3238806 RepID=UPI00384B90C3
MIEAAEPFADFSAALPGSRRWHGRASAGLAGGATHDSWRLAPFAPVFASAAGPYKTDVDGRRYVDLWMGHGSLILGHGDTETVAAASEQLRRGTHLSGLTPAMIEWAEAIQRLIPCAERVRFTASGSEASHLAFRVARAATGRRVMLRLGGHYHGWHENLLTGVAEPSAIGQAGEGGVEMLAHDDFAAIEDRLSARDVAAVLLEPGGGGSGALDWSIAGLRRLRKACDRTGTLLVFDEVISGFRYAPAGVQGLSGVTPDLTMLAKIMAGGWPGGALVGRADPMSVFASSGGGGLRGSVIYAGTFNGFAMSAAAGAVTLRKVADGRVQHAAEAAAQALVDAVNAAARRVGIDAGMFRNSSTVHLVLGYQGADVPLEPSAEAFQLIATQHQAHAELRRYLLIEGVDMHTTHGWVSAAHDDQAIETAARGFAAAFERLQRPGGVRAPMPCHERCHNPACAVRSREFAGCDLPLAERAD